MKQIILSEGKKDVKFLSEFFNKFDYRVKSFLREKIEGDSRKHRNEQDCCIRSFLELRSPFDILIKSEGGKGTLKKIFSSEAIHLVRNTKVSVIVDLNSTAEEKLNHISEDLRHRIKNLHKGGRFSVECADQKHRNDCLIASENFILKGSKIIGSFFIIGFKPSLEKVARIEDRDSREIEDNKIIDLLGKTNIFNFFRDLLIHN